MTRPRKRPIRQRMQITLDPCSNDLLRDISDKTFTTMSSLLDIMIMEYYENHKTELIEKGVELSDGENN